MKTFSTIPKSQQPTLQTSIPLSQENTAPEPLSLVQNGVRLKNPEKKYISIKRGDVKLRNAPFLGGKLSFILF
jgi:hypothetical protein